MGWTLTIGEAGVDFYVEVLIAIVGTVFELEKEVVDLRSIGDLERIMQGIGVGPAGFEDSNFLFKNDFGAAGKKEQGEK